MMRLLTLVWLCLLSCSLSMVEAQTVREQYKVKKKDTVYGIARKYDVTTEALEAVNPQMKADASKSKS